METAGGEVGLKRRISEVGKLDTNSNGGGERERESNGGGRFK